ncbi:hypothetical protein [Hyalangium rubrum]|uniref:Lysozyme inhibitor LprI N-terminal domain-containing protein n=1 Tax=Hyalangium rubrum TaxID=3103134 RepID=A0ABU5GVY7_9BACT|nr:hypothetical protein [Hyalangium sp. s54d21]MDY7225353.1 hypothetical protein [Hyalangium sp. s54d21]
MNARCAVLLWACVWLFPQVTWAASDTVLSAWLDKACPTAQTSGKGSQARQQCIEAAVRTAETARLAELRKTSGKRFDRQWESLQEGLRRWTSDVCSLKRQFAQVNLSTGIADLARESSRLATECQELHLGWWGQLAEAQARHDTEALGAGLTVFSQRAARGPTPAPKHVAIACELSRRALARPPQPLARGTEVVTAAQWEKLTEALASSFQAAKSLAELQCELIAGGGVTPPADCQQRLEYALLGQLKPLTVALDSTARDANPPIPSAQPAESAPQTWQSVYPCAPRTQPLPASTAKDGGVEG